MSSLTTPSYKYKQPRRKPWNLEIPLSTSRRHFAFMPLDLQIFRFILWINFVVDVVGFEIQLARGRHIADEFASFLLRIFLSSICILIFISEETQISKFRVFVLWRRVKYLLLTLLSFSFVFFSRLFDVTICKYKESHSSSSLTINWKINLIYITIFLVFFMFKFVNLPILSSIVCILITNI